MQFFRYFKIFLLTLMVGIYHDADAATHFRILPLGTTGGMFEDNLSSYLVASANSQTFIALDGGTVCGSINKISPSTFGQLTLRKISNKINLAEDFFKNDIKAYLISHAHLDHISGMVLCGINDGKKQILGSKSTIDILKNDIYNWKIWPNFTDQGQPPQLNQYQYRILEFNQNMKISGTDFTVKAFPLSHGQHYPSTAFLLEAKNFYLLYFGDTGNDRIEQSDDIYKIWQTILPKLIEKKLVGIFIEVSYENNRPDKLLFGHLTPKLLFEELDKLNLMLLKTHHKDYLKNFPIIVTHMKVGFDSREHSQVKAELEKLNRLKVKLIFPVRDKLIIV